MQAVDGGVFPGNVLGLRVDVHTGGGLCAEKQRRDRENAAAAAKIQHALAAMYGVLQLAHTHLGRGVRAGAEDHARVEQDLHALLRIFRMQPLRHDQQPLADGQRLIILFPAVFPVLIADVCQRDLERAELDGRMLCAQRGKLAAEQPDGLRGGGAVLKIEPDLGQTGHLPLQLLVHIVPVLPVLIEKFVEFLLIVYDKAVKTEHGEPLADQFDGGGCRFDGDFDPLHSCLQVRKCETAYSLHELRRNDKRYFTFPPQWSIIHTINHTINETPAHAAAFTKQQRMLL